MPELPEVESVRKVLKNTLLNQKLITYKITDKRINRFNHKKLKTNGLLSEIIRKGKVLQFKFENISFIFHLGMSGRLSLNSSKNKHTHGVFNFENDILLFDDIRKFGYIKILYNDDVENYYEKLGPDALNLTQSNKIKIMEKANKSSVEIKTFLLNQKNISGLGNIYVNEILFLSNIDPFISTFKLTSENMNTIFSNTRIILKKAINNNGTTLSDMTYYLPLGDYGTHQNSLLIYGRNICFSCSGKIDKLFINSRATYMCKKCQN